MTPKEKIILDYIIDRKMNRAWSPGIGIPAYVTVAAPLPLRRWNGIHPYDENISDYEVLPGTVLRVVNYSRMGDTDFGLTDDLEADHEYRIRVHPADGRIKNLRRTIEE